MSGNDQQENDGRVKVVDRRRFVLDEVGGVVERTDVIREDRPRPAPPAPAAKPAAPAAARSDASGPGIAGGAQAAPPRADAQPKAQSAEEKLATQIFLEFLNSLAHSMLVHLGETADPGSGLVRENLDAAQQTLEVLSVLRRKTEGNLTAQEQRLFDSLLYELMMRFRQRVESAPRAQVPPVGKRS